MSDVMNVFEVSYAKASRQSVHALVWMVFFSLAAIPGIWDVSLDKTLIEKEVAHQLLERWNKFKTPNLPPECTEWAEKQRRCERFKELMAKHQIQNRNDLNATLEKLGSQATDHALADGLKIFGLKFPWKHLVITRWAALALAAFFLYLYLMRENELMHRGLALAKREHEISSLYQMCSFSQLLISPPLLEDKDGRPHWRSSLPMVLLFLPCLVFFASMAFTYLRAEIELATYAHFFNLLFASTLVALFLGCQGAYRANCLQWIKWWELAKNEQGGLPYLGKSNFTVEVDEPEMQGFNHRGEFDISKKKGALKLAGTSYFRDKNGKEVACPWKESHTAVIGDQLLLKFHFQHLGQQIQAQMEFNIHHLSQGEAISGSYFQLLPEAFAVNGKVALGR